MGCFHREEAAWSTHRLRAMESWENVKTEEHQSIQEAWVNPSFIMVLDALLPEYKLDRSSALDRGSRALVSGLDHWRGIWMASARRSKGEGNHGVAVRNTLRRHLHGVPCMGLVEETVCKFCEGEESSLT